MKKRKFADGGTTFSPEQEKWLGGADRTDPFILARMRRAVPDSLAPVEDKKGTPVKSADALESKPLPPLSRAIAKTDEDAMEEANKGEDLAAELRGENTLMAMRDAESKPKVVAKQKTPTIKNTRDNESGKTRGVPAYGIANTRTGATAKMLKEAEEAQARKRMGSGGGRGPTAKMLKESTFKAGGGVKGWGQARGARAAKIV